MTTPSVAEFERPQFRIECWALLLLDASREAGLDPMPANRFHLTFYLANVLSPVWGGREIEGAVLKRQNSFPFYPDLQRAVDRLLGRGMITASNIRHVTSPEVGCRLEADYRVDMRTSESAIASVRRVLGNQATARYIDEILLALSSFSDKQLDEAFTQDATYGDDDVGPDNVVDYGEWLDRNASINAASSLSRLIPSNIPAAPGEQLHLYIAHLRERLVHAG